MLNSSVLFTAILHDLLHVRYELNVSTIYVMIMVKSRGQIMHDTCTRFLTIGVHNRTKHIYKDCASALDLYFIEMNITLFICHTLYLIILLVS